MRFRYFLMTENTFHASYLVTKWIDTFAGSPGNAGVVLREAPLSAELRRARAEFHRQHQGRRELTSQAWRDLEQLYPGLSETERAMVAAFGVPAHTVAEEPNTVFIGRKANDASVKEWLADQCSGPVKPFFFIFLDRMLAPWWIDLTGSRIINAHSAVLPIARGAHAIEQIAAAQDVKRFSASVGATAHYVDTGVDSGPIVAGARFNDPFQFDSIWDCKAHLFMLAFDVLANVAKQLTERPSISPLGIVPDLTGSCRDFKFAEFTEERRRQAELGYLAMRENADRS
ncbi:hypothetical protein F0L68_29815 [Solihabitans fulvus]|uniref:Formyl transferase N-terminal domain-containing protein n=1 Tax=Solihabitans fulvus TaxID=1892852 RepID=A0A5B2WUR7_9PSEU|nr:formyltransferase family protein [Solihabitans fulvus]KAA2254630.1 hypothetical protein F0L68_29815 [Solihabitans fulvus]